MVLTVIRPANADTPNDQDARVYLVRPGDTLSEIAQHLGFALDDILRWNPEIEADQIHAGQELHLMRERRRIEHEIERGQNLHRIARQWEVTIAEMLQWNPHLARYLIRRVQTLMIYTPIPESRSESIGTPQSGSLTHAEQLPTDHPAIWVRRPNRAWGTNETIRAIVEAFEHVDTQFEDSRRIEIHDLSFRRGGDIHGHRSHRSGRDADIAYYQTGSDALCRFRWVRPEQLDVARQWQLFHHWIAHEQVEAIFMDYRLQQMLYEHARSLGFSRHDLSPIFQYPRPIEDRYGMIRHHPRHLDHFHVRFVCHESDETCR